MGDVDFDEHTQIEYERCDHTAECTREQREVRWIGELLPEHGYTRRRPVPRRAGAPFALDGTGERDATLSDTGTVETVREVGLARAYRVWVSVARDIDHEHCRIIDHGYYENYRMLFWCDEATATRLRQDTSQTMGSSVPEPEPEG